MDKLSEGRVTFYDFEIMTVPLCWQVCEKRNFRRREQSLGAFFYPCWAASWFVSDVIDFRLEHVIITSQEAHGAVCWGVFSVIGGISSSEMPARIGVSSFFSGGCGFVSFCSIAGSGSFRSSLFSDCSLLCVGLGSWLFLSSAFSAGAVSCLCISSSTSVTSSSTSFRLNASV